MASTSSGIAEPKAMGSPARGDQRRICPSRGRYSGGRVMAKHAKSVLRYGLRWVVITVALLTLFFALLILFMLFLPG